MIEHAVLESISGTVTCVCGWTSGHYVLSKEADEAYYEHLRQSRTEAIIVDRDGIENL